MEEPIQEVDETVELEEEDVSFVQKIAIYFDLILANNDT